MKTGGLMKRLVIASALLAATLAAVGCGGSSAKSGSGTTASGNSAGSGSANGYGAASPGTTTQSTSGNAMIAVKSTSLGRILVDGHGMTLYLFEKDKGTTSTCNGSCAHFWPPVTTTGGPKPGQGITAARLGTTKRSDGATEVTYNGHPLYYYIGDTKPGDMTGQGLDAFGALWYVLSPAGKEIVS
jgi:predicted lipoprotein with Yx(FWY)xxD motif